MGLSDLAHDAALDKPDGGSIRAGRMDLRSHLRNALFPFGDAPQLSGFIDVVCQRFLAINMFATEQSRHGRRCVRVVGRRNVYRVDAIGEGIEHGSEIRKSLGGGVLFARSSQMVIVDIA
jgi:hypothetical protein